MAAQPPDPHRRVDVARLRHLLEDTPGFLAIVGRDMRFHLANAAYREVTGFEDVVGHDVLDLFPSEKYPESVGRIIRVLATGETIRARSAEFILPRPGEPPDRTRLLDYVLQPIRDGDHIIAVLVAGNDVTDQRRAEAQLRESEKRFRLIADSAPVPIWVSRTDRSREFVNKAYIEFTGLAHEAAAALDWRTILHPDDHDRIVAESIAGETSLKPFSLEARYRNADGQWRWIRSMSQPRLGADGQPNGFIGVAHDVTEAREAELVLRDLNATLEGRVAERTADLESALAALRREVEERERAEDALRQAQKMEAIGQLTGGIAHDFNNLLTPIIGGLELITRQLEDPRLLRMAQAALDSGRRGAKLATQLLAFSRLQRIDMAPVDVNSVIGEMGQIIRHTIGAGIEVASDLDDDAGHALCDANQLENAILNLAINARDAMPEGGRLSIATGEHRECGAPDLAEGTYVCITVTDSGEGMAPETVARAVEPFFSTKPVGKGTGLGLAQVYGIARQSGGTVRIESSEGDGTIVRVFLPRVTPVGESASRPAPGTVPTDSAAMTVLVVDDDPDVREFLVTALVELGHRALPSGSAADALARIDADDPDLVLVDFAMPGMNGAELAQEIRARRPGQRIVFVSGYAETDQLSAALGDDVPLLRKPFSLDELAVAIRPEG